MRNSTSTGTELVSALCRAAVGGPVHGDGLRHTLQTLVLGWVGLSKEAVKGLTGCLFGGKSEGGQGMMHALQTTVRSWVGLEGAKQGFHFASELPDATISSSAPFLRRDEHYFPALGSFGLIQQSNHREGSPLLHSLPFLKRLLRACLTRGITDVDLSRNGLRTVDVVEMIQVGVWPYRILLFLSHFVAFPLPPSFPSLHSCTVSQRGSRHRLPPSRPALRPQGTFDSLVLGLRFLSPAFVSLWIADSSFSTIGGARLDIYPSPLNSSLLSSPLLHLSSSTSSTSTSRKSSGVTNTATRPGRKKETKSRIL